MKRLSLPAATHAIILLAAACVFAPNVGAAPPPAGSGASAGSAARVAGAPALGAPNQMLLQPNAPAVQIVEPPESGMRADAFRVRVVLNPRLIDRSIYKSASVQTYPMGNVRGAQSTYTVVGIDAVLKGFHPDVGDYRGPIRVAVSISARDSYTPGEQLFVAERVSKVSGPLAPVGISAINAQNAQSSSGSVPNGPRPGPTPAPVPPTGQSPRFPAQAPASSFGSRP